MCMDTKLRRVKQTADGRRWTARLGHDAEVLRPTHSPRYTLVAAWRRRAHSDLADNKRGAQLLKPFRLLSAAGLFPIHDPPFTLCVSGALNAL
jgi:hypothetical protein